MTMFIQACARFLADQLEIGESATHGGDGFLIDDLLRMLVDRERAADVDRVADSRRLREIADIDAGVVRRVFGMNDPTASHSTPHLAVDFW